MKQAKPKCEWCGAPKKSEMGMCERCMRFGVVGTKS